MAERTPKLVIVGSCLVDELYSVKRMPGPGEEMRGCHSGRSPGGKAANSAVWAGLALRPILLVAALADDPRGRWLRARLERQDALELDLREISETATGLIFLTPDGERTVVFTRAEDPEPELTPELAERLRNEPPQLGWVQLGDRSKRAQFLEALARGGARRGIPLEHFRASAAQRPELVVGSVADAEVPETAELDQAGVELCVVTEGAAGGRWRERGGEWQRFEAVPPKGPLRSTLGAGDAFLGGLLARLAAGAEIEQALRHASYCGASAVCAQGAWPVS